MTGLIRDRDLGTIELDEATIAEVRRLGGRVFVVDSHDAWTPGELVRDGDSFVIRLEACIERGAKRIVRLKPRLTLSTGARP